MHSSGMPMGANVTGESDSRLKCSLAVKTNIFVSCEYSISRVFLLCLLCSAASVFDSPYVSAPLRSVLCVMQFGLVQQLPTCQGLYQILEKS